MSKKKLEICIPTDENEQKSWFKYVGIKMPKEEELRKVALFGIAHLAVNLGWDAKLTIKNWWVAQRNKLHARKK